MALSNEREHVPVFVDDLSTLYVLEDGKPRSLADLLPTLTPDEIDLPVMTTKLISDTDAQGMNRYYSVSRSPV